MRSEKRLIHRVLAFMICCFFSLTVYGQEVAILPYRVIANKMIVEVVINGKAVAMIFDTGGRNSISSRLKNELGLPVLSSRELTDANSNKMKSELVNLEEVRTSDGKMTVKSIPFFVFDNELFACLGVEGFIGSDLFPDHTVEIDDLTKEIKITKGGMASLNGNRRTVPFADNANGFPIVTLNIGKYDETRVLFDTGSDGFLFLKQKEYRRLEQEGLLHVIKEGQGGGSIGASGAGGIGRSVLVEVSEMGVGQASFLKFRASVGNPPETLFGYKSLQYGKATIDYVNKLFLFEPFNPGETEVISKKSWDLELRVVADQLVIATVWDKMKGQAEVGDVVSHINGEVVKPMSFCESITTGLPVLKENDQVVLTVITKQGAKKITIHKS